MFGYKGLSGPLHEYHLPDLTANSKVATVLASIPAFFFTVEPEAVRLSSVEYILKNPGYCKMAENTQK
jgi:hypothetical protein